MNMASPSPFCCKNAACTAAPSRDSVDFRFCPLRDRLKFEVVGDYNITTEIRSLLKNTIESWILIGLT